MSKDGVSIGVDWGNGESYAGRTLVLDGKVIGKVTSFSPSKSGPAPSTHVIVQEGPDIVLVPRVPQTYEATITKMLVNWPLMADLKRQEMDELLRGRELDELSADELVQLSVLSAVHEDMKNRPNEFEGITEEPQS